MGRIGLAIMIGFLGFVEYPTTGFAGNANGNSSAGGDGVDINGQIYLLDFVEVNIHNNVYFRNRTSDAISTVAESIRDHIGIDWESAELISAKLNEVYDKLPIYEFFLKRWIFTLNWNLVPQDLIGIEDDDRVIDFPSHDLVQLAVRQNLYVFINEDAWNELSIENRSGLISPRSPLCTAAIV